MGTHIKEAETRHVSADDVYAAIEAHGSGVAMALLWMVPVLVFVGALVRSLG